MEEDGLRLTSPNDDGDPSTPHNPKKIARINPKTDPVLPPELITEIFSWLPVKSLLRFRCLSKFFKALTSDPKFIKTHLGNSKTLSRTKPDPSKRLVLAKIDARSSLKTCSLHSIFNNPATDAVELDSYGLNCKNRYDWLVGSCDGLLCVAVNRDFVVVSNPSTKVFNILPQLGLMRRLGSYMVFGFGYDSGTDDYKVVSVFCYERKGGNVGNGMYQSDVQICSLRDRYWKSVGEFGFGCIPYDYAGKFVSGRLCWPALRSDGISMSVWVIVGFDLAQEVYEEVMQPEYSEDQYCKTLGVLDGCLCIMCSHDNNVADLWVMREYGVRESWTKLIRIPYLGAPLQFQYSPIFVSDDGEVLMELRSTLVIYNVKDGMFRHPVVNGVRSCSEAETYTESLVSPIIQNQE